MVFASEQVIAEYGLIKFWSTFRMCRLRPLNTNTGFDKLAEETLPRSEGAKVRAVDQPVVKLIAHILDGIPPAHVITAVILRFGHPMPHHLPWLLLSYNI